MRCHLHNRFISIKMKEDSKLTNMKYYLKLMRIKHYIKNLLIFFPLVFSRNLFTHNFFNVMIAAIAFSLLSSAVYVLNDIKDAEKDREHSVKKNRPIASGAVTVSHAVVFLVVLILISVCLSFIAYGFSLTPWLITIIYFVLNLGYSFGLKNIPLIDIAILTSGFLLRAMLGAVVINVTVSNWLYLTIMSLAFYLSLAKRRNELAKQESNNTRKVLKFYNYNFLDKNMTVFLTLSLVFYSLWCINAFSSQIMVFSIPILMLIVLRYSMIIENDSQGDPVDVVLTDIPLLLVILIYIILIFSILYLI